MSSLRVLVANEPESYREAFSSCLQHLRPGIEVVALQPEDLDQAVKSQAPSLVLCSHVTPTVEDKALAWIEFNAESESLMVVSLPGLRLRVIDDGLPALLSIVDRVELLVNRDP